METIVIAVHVLAAASIIGFILLQQGKGAEMGASFGSGSSQALFGPQGSGTVFSRATAILTAIFFATSFWLAIIAKQKINGNVAAGIPSAQVIEAAQKEAAPAATKPAESEIPSTTPDSSTGDIPKK